MACAFAAEQAVIGVAVVDANTRLPIAGAELVLRYANTAARLTSTMAEVTVH